MDEDSRIDLKSKMENFLDKESIAQDSSIKVSIIGRPNAGKSSFLNAVLKEERVLVDSKAHTTRDPI